MGSMKAKVLKSFADAEKKVIHQVGKIIELSKERFDQIISLEGEPLIEKADVKPNKEGD